MVKNPPAKQEIQVHSLGPKDDPEKETATHSSILASEVEIPWTDELAGATVQGVLKESDLP